MIAFDDNSQAFFIPRLHPYLPANSDQVGYIDFTAEPDQIELVLEDFKPLAHTSAVKVFYDFLRWINGPESHLKTSDCALRAPEPHNDRHTKHLLSTHGRLFVLFRELRYNSTDKQSSWLYSRMKHELQAIDGELAASKGIIGLTKQPALQLELSNGRYIGTTEFESGLNDPGRAQHLMISFWEVSVRSLKHKCGWLALQRQVGAVLKENTTNHPT